MQTPPLNESVVIGYSGEDADYPIIGIRKDPASAGYRAPIDGSSHPNTSKYPLHTYTGTRASDSFDSVTWIYEILPGPWLPFMRYDDLLGPIQGRRRAIRYGPTSIIVSSAGTAGVNGTYSSDGMVSGRQNWYNGGTKYISWDEVTLKWQILDENFVYYESSSNVPTPDLATGWVSVSGSNPAPTVTGTLPAPSFTGTTKTTYEARDGSAHVAWQIEEGYDAITDIYLTYPKTMTIPLPRVLNGVKVIWETSTGDGSATETGDGVAAGDSPSLSLSIQGSGQGSASVLPEIIPDISRPEADETPVFDAFFFLAQPMTMANILSRVATLSGLTIVGRWPKFNTKPHTIIGKGQKVSVRLGATAQCSVGLGSSVSVVTSEGSSQDKDFGSSIIAVDIEPTIHGLISIADATETETCDADASAVITAGTNYPGASSTPSTLVGTASGVVTTGETPSNELAATTPAAIPSTGYYAYRVDTAAYNQEFGIVRVTILNAADL